MHTASVENHKTGTPFMTYNEFKLTRSLEKKYKQKITL